MKIRVFSYVDERDGKPDAFVASDSSPDLHVRVEHDGCTYDLALDHSGRLALRTVGGQQIQIEPVAANVVRIGARR